MFLPPLLVIFSLHLAICVLCEKCSELWMELKPKKRDDGGPKRMGEVPIQLGCLSHCQVLLIAVLNGTQSKGYQHIRTIHPAIQCIDKDG
jgi:hypothetical protein